MTGVNGFSPMPMPTVTHDVMISAVRYDALFVADLSERVAAVLGATPYWRGMSSDHESDRSALAASTRLAIVVHQRLWSHDAATSADATELREIASRSPLPVCVICVDEEPIPTWLMRSGDLAVHATSVADVLEQVRELFPDATLHGRRTVNSELMADGDPPRPGRWGEGPPYLDQPRSLSALRHALDDLEAELGRRVQSEKEHAADRNVKLHCAPGRIIAQLAGVGLSFSWVPARSGAVADGRLLVIEWEGVVAHGRGMGAMRTASPGRERVFQPVATGPGDLRWRSVDSAVGSYTSLDLAGQAFAGALLTLGGLTEAQL